MPKLHQVIGTILRDIAQSRVYSDIYSYEVSVHYEKDSLLRQFPVPRAEITELELDLKFAFSDRDVKMDTDQDGIQRIGIFRTQTNFLSRYLLQDTVRYTEQVLGYAWEKRHTEKENKDWEALKKTLLWKQHENRVQQIIVEYFDNDFKRGSGKSDTLKYDMNVPKAEKDLTKQIEGYLYSVDEINKHIGKVDKAKATLSQMIESKLHRDLTKIEEEVEFMMNMVGASSPEVDIAVEKLVDLPPEIISTVKVTTGVRNYLWTKISDDDDGRAIRKLMPE